MKNDVAERTHIGGYPYKKMEGIILVRGRNQKISLVKNPPADKLLVVTGKGEMDFMRMEDKPNLKKKGGRTSLHRSHP